MKLYLIPLLLFLVSIIDAERFQAKQSVDYTHRHIQVLGYPGQYKGKYPKGYGKRSHHHHHHDKGGAGKGHRHRHHHRDKGTEQHNPDIENDRHQHRDKAIEHHQYRDRDKENDHQYRHKGHTHRHDHGGYHHRSHHESRRKQMSL